MATATAAAWRCSVCGYVHRGSSPPDCCPVCGAPPSDFEPYVEPAATAAAAAPRQWQCLNCNYVHEGDGPPDLCPICGAGPDQFAPVTPAPPVVSASGAAESVVIVGGGIAGVSAAEAVRGAVPSARVTVVGEEAPLPYYRLNLTRYLADEIRVDALPIHPPEWYTSRGIAVVGGDPAQALDTQSRTLTLRSGERLSWQRLILAMGSHPFVPSLEGASLDGVYSLRTLSDAQAILDAARGGAPCVCIGGGVLGLETAVALARRGANVTLLESHGWLMPRQLNREAGEVLRGYVTAAGVTLRERARTRAVTGAGRVAAVALEDGATLPAGAVILATGVRPNTHLARRSGLAVNKGILVDGNLRASSPGVFAAGDVAEFNGMLYGAWGASQYQGSIAGLNAAGVPTPFGGLPRSNSLKVLGIDMLSIGEFEPPDGSYQVIDLRRDGEYFHFVFRDGVLAGAILLGRTAVGPAVKRAVEQKTDLSGLLGRHPAGADVLAHFEARA